MSEQVSAKERAVHDAASEFWLSYWDMEPRPGLAEVYREGLDRAVRKAVSSALASGAEREWALREELEVQRGLSSAGAGYWRQLHDQMRTERNLVRGERDDLSSRLSGAVSRYCDAENKAYALETQLVGARAEIVRQSGLRSDDLVTLAAAKDAEIARLNASLLFARNTSLGAPRAPERSPEWIAAAEACVACAREGFGTHLAIPTHDIPFGWHWTDKSLAAQRALRALDASRARPGQDEERAVEAAMEAVGPLHPDGIPSPLSFRIVITALAKAGLLRDGGGA